MMNQTVNNYVPGTGYSNFMPRAKMTQPLSKEDMNLLRRNTSAFSLAITPQDRARGICTHKENGHFTLVENPDGTVRCTICGKTFGIVDGPVQEVAQITQRFIDVLQSIKTWYYDISEQTAVEFFQMLPLLEKVPQLYEIALKNAEEHDNPQMYNQNNMPYGFNTFNNILGMGGVPQQPMMNNQYNMQQPVNYGCGVPQQPMMNNQYGTPQQPMMNNQYSMNMQQPVNYGCGVPQQPMMNNQGGNPFYNGQQPNQPQAPAQNIAPQNVQHQPVEQNANSKTGQTIQQTKTFNV